MNLKVKNFLSRYKISFSKENIVSYVLFLFAFIFAFLYFSDANYTSHIYDDYYSDYEEDPYESYEDCNIQGLDIYGEIYTYMPNKEENDYEEEYEDTKVISEEIIYDIKSANLNPFIKAIFINVDSQGGSPVGGEEISIAIKNSEKPVIALIHDLSASAGYWAISSADHIFASRNSTIGSIGVTMSYLNEVELNNKEGYKLEELASGKFKDSGTPYKNLTKEEKDIFMRDLIIMHDNFIEDIAQNRNLGILKIRSIADGSTVLGERAKELGLIDEIGSIYDAEKYLENLLGEKPEICWNE